MQLVEAGERAVLEELAAGKPLPDLLHALAVLLEDVAEDALASILLIDETETGTRLVHGAAPSLPQAYVRAIDGSAIGAAAGSCGTAAFRRETVFVADVLADPLWADYREPARAAGVRACWSSPIIGTSGGVLGTFAVFQEALTNVARHAGAGRVEVHLGLDGGKVALEVVDDGVGVSDARAHGGSLGLLGMRERATRLGGTFAVERAAPKGTRVAVTIPL
jgi:signal transduction histidine kinase